MLCFFVESEDEKIKVVTYSAATLQKTYCSSVVLYMALQAFAFSNFVFDSPIIQKDNNFPFLADCN